MTTRLKIAGVIVAAGLMMPATALAFGAQTGNDIVVSKDSVHNGTLYAAGKNITVNGDLNGDLVCAGQTILINGTVRGDVLCAGSDITINGKVLGSVRVADMRTNINGSVGRNVNALGQYLTIGGDSQVAGEAAFVGQSMTINGSVKQDAYGSMSQLDINGPVSGSVTAWQPTSIGIGPEGKVAGNLSYTTDSQLSLDDSKVAGKVEFHKTPMAQKRTAREETAVWAGNWFYWTVAVLIIALLLAWLAPRMVKEVSDTLRQKAGVSLGIGALSMIVVPVAAIILMITVFGAPLGLLALGSWVLLMSLSGSIVAVTAGRWVLGKVKWKTDSLIWAAVVGVPVAMLVFSVPVFGGLVSFIAALWGTGGLILALRSLR
jgi:cytoskeletal protein CcmA (bactofilin family)